MKTGSVLVTIAAIAAACGIGYYVVKRTQYDSQAIIPVVKLVPGATAVGARSMGIY